MHESMRDVFALFLLERLLLALFVGRRGAACCNWFCHYLKFSVLSTQFSVTPFSAVTENRALRAERCFYAFAVFFFCATVPLRGPLRVRALVCVRCPRTGRLRR